ncbi:MAG: indole-3-glycerol phosphate synthase TrpC [Lachnospiraceae bacterium]|nr:indole-3-glycerol phosphate synthase TrpC [Lachnospiraceae bacterium]MDD3660369.1 indole-3-glycerol phosphate synthase TrpC [Lachnospiraceae bacterium]
MILDDIVEAKKKRLLLQKEEISEKKMVELAANFDRESISFYRAMAGEHLSIIGEFKNASPSHGQMNQKISLSERITEYNASVDAISCLTEEDYFHGGVSYFKEIREMTMLPMIRKDFIIDPYQIFEAKLIGADCVLLIAAILNDRDLKRFYELSYLLGMDVLVEVHDEDEMKRAIGLDAAMIGINNRNLKDFTIDLHTTKRLAAMVPEETLLIAESGINCDDDIVFLKQCGVKAVLVGTALMEAESPKQRAGSWKDSYEKN